MTCQDIAQKLCECRQTAERGEPLSIEELREFNTLRAREMARAEARRQPSPQLPLERAA